MARESRLNEYQYYLNEIVQQPNIITKLLQQYLHDKEIAIDAFGEKANTLLERVHRIQIITTPSSYHVGLMARYWLEEISGIPCQIEMACDYIKRIKVIESNKLCVILSKTGDEIESLNALSIAKDIGYVAIFGISNIKNSTIIRESDMTFLTNVGNHDDEIYMNSAQTFAGQLTGLFLLAIALGRYHRLNKYHENNLLKKLEDLPEVIKNVIQLNPAIRDYSTVLAENDQAVYLGRDIQFPIALEGAALLKELTEMSVVARIPEEFMVNPFKSLVSPSYHLPIIALAPSYDIFEQWKANFQNFEKLEYEVFIISDKKFDSTNSMNMKILPMPAVDRLFSPMVYSIPMQLLACHVGMNRELLF